MIPIIFQSHMDKNANDGEHLVTARDNVGEGWKIKAPFPVETVWIAVGGHTDPLMGCNGSEQYTHSCKQMHLRRIGVE